MDLRHQERLLARRDHDDPTYVAALLAIAEQLMVEQRAATLGFKRLLQAVRKLVAEDAPTADPRFPLRVLTPRPNGTLALTVLATPATKVAWLEGVLRGLADHHTAAGHDVAASQLYKLAAKVRRQWAA